MEGANARGNTQMRGECNAEARMCDGEVFARDMENLAQRAALLLERAENQLAPYLREPEVTDALVPACPTLGSEYFRKRSEELSYVDLVITRMNRLLDRFEG